MSIKKRTWDFITVGNKTFQYKNEKLMWVINWR